jgi:hypothetical protein
MKTQGGIPAAQIAPGFGGSVALGHWRILIVLPFAQLQSL